MLLLFASIDALKIRRGPLCVQGLKNMIRRFELTGDLGTAPGRDRRPFAPEIFKEVSVTMAENAGRNVDLQFFSSDTNIVYNILRTRGTD